MTRERPGQIYDFSTPEVQKPKQGRREFFRNLVYASAALGFVDSEKLWAQEIKGGENWSTGYKYLREEVMSGKNEVTSIFLIDKKGKGEWQKFVLGTDESVSNPEEFNGFLKQKARVEGNIIVDVHTHPLNAVVKFGEVSEAQAKKMRETENFPKYSVPPTVGQILNNDGDIAYAINKTMELNKENKASLYINSVMDLYGAWFYTVDKDHPFSTDFFEATVKVKEIAEMAKMDPAAKKEENQYLFKKDSELFNIKLRRNPIYLSQELGDRGFSKEVINSVSKFEDLSKKLAIYKTQCLDFSRFVDEFRKEQLARLKTSEPLDKKEFKDRIALIKLSAKIIGVNITLLDNEGLKNLDPQELLKVLKVK